MARVYDSVDLFWSYDGDISFDEVGDVRDTTFDYLRSIRQEIMSRVRSDKGDWRWHPGLGANLSEFVGEANSLATAQAIRTTITDSLIWNNLVNADDVLVQVVPVNSTTLALRVKIQYQATRKNSTSSGVTLHFMYDYADNHVFPVQKFYEED